MLRFTAVTVPFAARELVLEAGAVLSPELLAELVAANAQPGDVAVVCADRPTRLAATAAFRAALQRGLPAGPQATTVAPRPARFQRPALVPAQRPARGLSRDTVALREADRLISRLQQELRQVEAQSAERLATIKALEARLAGQATS